MSMTSDFRKNNSNIVNHETLNSSSTGSANMIVLNQNDGTYIIGERIFSVDALNIEASSVPMEYTNVILEESAIELISDQTPYEPAKINENDCKELTIKNLINDIQTNLTNGFDKINKKIRKMNNKYKNLELTVDSMLNNVKAKEIVHRVSFPSTEKRSGSIIVGVDSTNSALIDDTLSKSSEQNSNTKFDQVPLLDIYPDGSWLGDPNNASKCIRCAIKQSDLNQLRRKCLTPEKMALSLLDYLFDRETQATSNISGTSKHNKKQLDPVKIYGIRCHLEYVFDITNKEWQRIKQNIDSKCRTAFRRKIKGMPLKVKSFRLNMALKKCNEDGEALKAISCNSKQEEAQNVVFQLNNDEPQQESLSTTTFKSGNTVPIAIHTSDGYTFSLPAETIEQDSHMIQVHEDGKIQIIHTTSEQLTQFQLAGAQVLEQFENHLAEEIIVPNG